MNITTGTHVLIDWREMNIIIQWLPNLEHKTVMLMSQISVLHKNNVTTDMLQVVYPATYPTRSREKERKAKDIGLRLELL